DYGEGMQMLRTFWDAAVALDPAAATRDERHMPLCMRGTLTGQWRTHGLQDVDEQPLTIDMAFESFDDYWQPFLGGPGPARVDLGRIRPARLGVHAGGTARRSDDACAGVGGPRRRHLIALPNSRQSCGSALMLGSTA